MVRNDPEHLVQPQLWSGERLLWWERPTAVGAVVAQLSYAYKRADAAVDFFSAPLSLLAGASIVGVPLVVALLIFPFGLAVVVAALVGALAAGVYGWLRARATWYAITDRRVMVVRGSDADWTLHEAWDDARVAWRLGGIGSIAFRRRGEGDLDVRLVGVRDATAILDIVNRAALARPRRHPPSS